MANLLRFDFNDRDGIFEVVENGDWVRATDYDALAAKLAEVTEDRDDALIALASARKQLERYIGEAEAALPAVDPRIMEFLQHVADGSAKDYTNNHKWAKELIAAIRTLPTAAELMARINEGEK